jgi:hypothetical protein
MKLMPMKYSYRKLLEREREELQRVFEEEEGRQRWFAVAVISFWHREVFLTLN